MAYLDKSKPPSDVILEFGGGQGGGFEPGRRAGVDAVGEEIEAAVDQGAVAGEHHDGQILALALRHVAAGARERFGDGEALRRQLAEPFNGSIPGPVPLPEDRPGKL